MDPDQTARMRRLVWIHCLLNKTLFFQISIYPFKSGVAAPLYLNAIWRLNREYGADIDTDKFRLEAKFEKSSEDDRLSLLVLKAVSKCDQQYNIGMFISYSSYYITNSQMNLRNGFFPA
jgi:hypothetical protein